ncbi:MAG: hypothetical protein VX901_06790 [Candidatus Poribacteria bacterium]|nr:hypothetical protein [Candidatus Poribacteria bacterium]
MMVIIFGGVVLVMIWAGVLISKLAEIGKADQNKKSWIWGVLLLIFLISVPLLLIGVILITVQFSEVNQAFENFK